MPATRSGSNVRKTSYKSVLITALIHYMVNLCASVLGVQLPALASVVLVTVVLVVAWIKELAGSRSRNQVQPDIQLTPIPTLQRNEYCHLLRLCAEHFQMVHKLSLASMDESP
jgi:hypothetical protein